MYIYIHTYIYIYVCVCVCLYIYNIIHRHIHIIHVPARSSRERNEEGRGGRRRPASRILRWSSRGGVAHQAARCVSATPNSARTCRSTVYAYLAIAISI